MWWPPIKFFGVVVGCINFRDDGDYIDCTKMGVGGKAIPGLVDRISDISGTGQFVLLIEKDASFTRLSEDRFYLQYPWFGLYLCGKRILLYPPFRDVTALL
jgi:DNA topoisomerase VI subunit A